MPRHPQRPTDRERNRRTQERIRKKEIEARPTASGGGGGTDAWCDVLAQDGWVGGSTIGKSSAMGVPDSVIQAQSGGFTQVDAYTIEMPPGVWTVDWVFGVEWNLLEDFSSDFNTTNWLMWTGGAIYQGANSVMTYNLDNGGGGVAHLAPYHLRDHGAITGARTGMSGADTYWAKEFTVRATATQNLLSLGIRSIELYMGHTPDATAPVTIHAATPFAASGDSYALIQGSGAAQV